MMCLVSLVFRSYSTSRFFATVEDDSESKSEDSSDNGDESEAAVDDLRGCNGIDIFLEAQIEGAVDGFEEVIKQLKQHSRRRVSCLFAWSASWGGK
jgi:hypothetical protein